jgi:polysaccharide biosynthesis/export protein
VSPILFGLVLLLFAGCATAPRVPAGTARDISQPAVSAEAAAVSIIEREDVSVPTLAAADEEPPPPNYIIGPNDVLYVNVAGRPELGSPVGPSIATTIQGSRVDGNGDIHLPLIGAVPVSGLTIGEARDRLQQEFKRYVNEPWVVVEIAEYRSQPLYLLGQFRSPGTVYMDRPVNLLQGIAMGKGLTDAANLRGARLVRDERTQPVDVYDLLHNGAKDQNVWLRPGDTVFIPDDKAQTVFVFGGVSKPGPVPMIHGALTLPQAIAAATLRDIGYDLSRIRIIRSLSTTRGQLLVVDADRMIRGETLPYPLLEGDIVYVPKSGLGTWNDAIREILPSLQAVSAFLQPFVQIKFLSD